MDRVFGSVYISQNYLANLILFFQNIRQLFLFMGVFGMAMTAVFSNGLLRVKIFGKKD